MKKIFLLSLFILLLGHVAKGQAALLVLIFGEKAASENFYFSLKAGVNYSMIMGYDEGKNRVGLNFGLVNNIRLNEKFFLTPEFVALSPRGVRDIEVLSTGNPSLDTLLTKPITTDRKLSYIDIPLLLEYRISERWSVSAGPQFSFLTGASDLYESRVTDKASLKTEIDIKNDIRSFDIGAVLNLSFMVSEATAGKGMNLYFRYTQGFRSLFTDEAEGKFYNGTLQFGAAFPFIEKQAR